MKKVHSVLNDNNLLSPQFHLERLKSEKTPANGITDRGCPLCHDRGLIISEDGERAIRCQCMSKQAAINKFRSAKLSKSMLECRFKQFNPGYYDKNLREANRGRSFFENAQIAYRLAQQFVAEAEKGSRPDGILFSGNVGSGKTFLASCIANALLEKGFEVLFLVVPDLLDELRATYDPANHHLTELELLDTARNVAYLVLDDLGAHNYTDWTRNKIYSIINYRLNNRLPTVITTNLDLNDLEQYLGDRTTSRLVQLCQVVQLLVDTDIRIQKRSEQGQHRNKLE